MKPKKWFFALDIRTVPGKTAAKFANSVVHNSQSVSNTKMYKYIII